MDGWKTSLLDPSLFSGAFAVSFQGVILEFQTHVASCFVNLWGECVYPTMWLQGGGTLPETNIAPENGWLEY